MSFHTTNTLSYLGVKAPNPPVVIISNRSPLTSDVGYDVGTIWINVPIHDIFMLAQVQDAMAAWISLGGGTTDLLQLTGNVGTATPIAGSIAVTGISGIFTTGGPGSLVISPVSPFTVFNSVSDHLDAIQIINNATGLDADSNLFISVNGASAGDPYITFTNLSNTWVMGMDNRDGDKFKISFSTYPGTDDYFVIDTSGNITLGNLTLSGLTVNGSTTLNGATIINSTLNVNGVATQNGTFTVTNAWSSFFTGDVTCNSLVELTNGNLVVSGNGVELRFTGVRSGLFLNNAANSSFGTVQLSGGTITVANTWCTTSSTVFVQKIAIGGSHAGILYSTTANGSFTVTSYDVDYNLQTQDASVIAYLIIQHP